MNDTEEFELKILEDLRECRIMAIQLPSSGRKNGEYYAGKREVLEWLAKEIELDVSAIATEFDDTEAK